MTRPTGLSLSRTRMADGVWEGILIATDGVPPKIEAQHQGQALAEGETKPIPGKPGQFAVRLPLPTSLLTEGVQTVLLLANGQMLDQITLVVGVPLEDDLRAEISLLRAELDLLKRAFRRHCAETAA